MYPKRSDFCPKFDGNFNTFNFLPNTYHYRVKFNGPDRYSYVDIIGIMSNGSRCLVRCFDLPIFVDLLITKNSEEFIKNYNYEKIKMISGRGLSLPQTYARIYFDNIMARLDFIKTYNDQFELANNDKDFHYLFHRVADFNTAGWNAIEKFEKLANFKYKNSRYNERAEDTEKLPYQFVVDYRNIKRYGEVPERLKKDRSIICAWDLETYTDNNTGGVPQPDNPLDKIKMCSMVFRYHWSKENLCTVLLTEIPITYVSQEYGKLFIIETKDIIMEFSRVIKHMQPEFITGYNDGNYDWPFFKKRMTNEEEFLSNISALKLTSNFEKTSFGCMKFTGFPQVIRVKIDAENNAIYDGFTAPGVICFDTAMVMRRQNKTETKWGLNTFLAKYGIKLKEDMPYSTMSQIFNLWQLMGQDRSLLENDYVIPFPNDGKVGNIAINTLNSLQIKHILALTDMVGVYCIRDSAACLDLLEKVSTISDYRDFVTTSNTPMIDGFYRADGIKVQNCIFSAAMKAEWGCWQEKYPIAFSIFKKYVAKPTTKSKEEKIKYPGGHVIAPEKGIYARTGIDKFRSDFPELWNEIVKKPDLLFTYRDKIRELCDRPCSGLDFSSLYPSLIMCFNLSPEYFIKMENKLQVKQWFEENNILDQFKILETSTHYKKDSEEKSNQNKVEGAFLQQISIAPNETCKEWQYKNQGIFPTILRRFFAQRRAIKGLMGKYETILEKINRDVLPRRENAEMVITLDFIETIIREKITIIKNKSQSFVGKKLELENNKIAGYERALKLIQQEFIATNDFDKFLEHVQFNYTYYNIKQLTIKVFMNTFYGEMGNPNSPFFIPIMSGSVTKMGRRSLKAVKKLVESQNYHVYYGDTDSVYISAPVASFAECDEKYLTNVKTNLINGELLNIDDKERYYEEMVGITMDKLTEISAEVGNYFCKLHGNPFLKMEYEEVLFPFGFSGKKNYFGVKHVATIDFSLCRNPDAKTFMKELFVRGPYRRRNESNFTKECLNDLLIQFTSLENNDPYDKIIYNQIESRICDFTKNPLKYVKLVAKNYSFREPRENTRTAQMAFRERMLKFHIMQQINTAVYAIRINDNIQDIDKSYNILSKYFIPNCPHKMTLAEKWHGTNNIKREFEFVMYDINLETYVVDENLLKLEFLVPNYGDRCDLVLTKRPDNFTGSGKKSKKKKGDQLEYPEMLNNNYYIKFLCSFYERAHIDVEGFTAVEIDVENYFGDVYGKMARFLIYRPESAQKVHEKFIEKGGNKKALKQAELDVIKDVKKELIMRYKNYFPEIKCNNAYAKERFKEIKKKYEQQVGTSKLAGYIREYITDNNYSVKKLLQDVARELDRVRILHFKIDQRVLKIDRFFINSQISNKESVLKNKLKNICLSLQRMNWGTINMEEIIECQKLFVELEKMKLLEYAIKMKKTNDLENIGVIKTLPRKVVPVVDNTLDGFDDYIQQHNSIEDEFLKYLN